MKLARPLQIALFLAFLSSAPAKATVTTGLFQDLKGFGSGTTGGQAGSIYVVDKTTDTGEEGTLRHAVETGTEPRWIVFSPTVFPANVKKAIYLETALEPRDNITIDGRGSYVSLRKRYSYADAQWNEVSPTAAECVAVETPTYDMGPMLLLRSKKNIVITHIDFAKIYEGTPPAYDIIDKQCFGDVITIYNAAGDQATQYFDKIWINQSNFVDCGDECIAITRGSSAQRGNISISNNYFKNTYKAIVAGSGNEGTQWTALSIYQNRFLTVRQRSPRAQAAVSHVFNNAYENWLSHGIAVMSDHSTAIEQNVFYAGDRTIYPWVAGGTPVTPPFSWNNQYYGVTNSSSYENAAPASPSPFDGRLGDAVDLSGMSFSAALNWIRAKAGWKDSINDAQ